VGDFAVAFDDSGGIEPLCDWQGQFIPGDHPLTALGAFYVRQSKASSFRMDWQALREEMGRTLGVRNPPVHMRLMWGRSRPHRYRKAPNPFLGVDHSVIVEWVKEAWAIIDRFTEARDGGWFYGTRARKEAAQNQIRFLTNEHFTRERRFLAQHRVRGKSLYNNFHRLITSPLLQLYVIALPQINELMCACRRSTADVLVDSFNDSHGVDELEVVRTLKEVCGLRYIDSVARVPDGDMEPILQAADLVAYTGRRIETANAGLMSPDKDLIAIAGDLYGQTVTRANIAQLTVRRFPNLAQIALTIHYSLARAHALRFDKEFTDRYLVPVEEFYRRAAQANTQDVVGISVLTQEAQELAHSRRS
jgi:hypothetical protein